VSFLPFLAPLVLLPAVDPGPLQLNDNDCVVFIGSALIEREQRYGYWEAALTARFPGKTIRFRNLGWSGDNVFGEAQAGFGSVADGFRHLKDHVLALKPGAIFVGYGSNEAFDGPGGLSRFTSGLDTLLDALAPSKARFVLLTPPRQEDLGRPLPSPAAQNENLRLYAKAIRETSAKRKTALVDFFSMKPYEREAGAKAVAPDVLKEWGMPPPCPLTDNGVHFTPFGYWWTGGFLMRHLDPGQEWRVEADANGKVRVAQGVRVEALPGTLRYRITDAFLPRVSPIPGSIGQLRTFRVSGLEAGSYTLTVDGRPIARKAELNWDQDSSIESGPEFDQSEKLRAAIVAKNLLYFHRWRPQNETYLFGFRKHEQGQNAREIPQFDPLIAVAEKEIAKLAVPVPHTYELKRDESK
jgi:lysophospholipase L1-like esterase